MGEGGYRPGRRGAPEPSQCGRGRVREDRRHETIRERWGWKVPERRVRWGGPRGGVGDGPPEDGCSKVKKVSFTRSSERVREGIRRTETTSQNRVPRLEETRKIRVLSIP